jgi:hypothetical protein
MNDVQGTTLRRLMDGDESFVQGWLRVHRLRLRTGIGAYSACGKSMRHIRAALLTTNGKERTQTGIRPWVVQ